MPCMVRWPGKIAAGRESAAPIAAIDLLPTLCQACGIDLKKISKGSPVIDGVNVMSTLTGERDVAHARDELLYWHGANGCQAIRVGNWKLFFERHHAGLRGGQGPALFHLTEDIAEKNDLSAKFPDRVKVMKARAEKRLAEIRADIIPLAK